MINIKAFTERLQTLMDHYEVSASGFAEKIGVQRSSISHILSGRNKPSLEFVLKIVHHYPEADLYWLLNGKGNFPKLQNLDKIDQKGHVKTSTSKNERQQEESIQTPIASHKLKNQANASLFDIQNEMDIDRIVIFFSDGTFKSYKS